MDVRIGTYNVGSGWADYSCMAYASHQGQQGLFTRVQNSHPPAILDLMHKANRSEQEREALRAEEEGVKRTLIGAVEQSVALRLVAALDIICLQEVVTMERPFIETLRQSGFRIYPGKEVAAGRKERFSTAVALRNDRFSSVKNISIITPGREKAIFGQEVAAIVGTFMDSSVTLSVASLHSWSFKLYNPQRKETPRFYSPEDVQNQQASEEYLAQAMDLLQKQDADFSLMAGDLNNNPENYSPVFDHIMSRGFAVLSPFASTTVDRFDENYPLRVIDLIFPKEKKPFWESFCETFASSSKSTLKITWTAAHVLEGFEFTIDRNCSNHKPVKTVITISQP